MCNRQYNEGNIFAKIISNMIPCEKVAENEHALAFKDIHPKANVHVLVIPKGKYIDMYDFVCNASDQEQLEYNRLLSEVLGHCQHGRVESNYGRYQEVHHLHIHVLADKWV